MEKTNETATHAPKTRRALAKAQRRQALIDATIESIADFGLSGTTMGTVAEIAGTSVGLANFHFSSKERLFEAVLQHLAEVEGSLWQKHAVDPALSAADRMIALVDARFHSCCCNPRTLAVWFAFWGDASAREIYRRIVEDLDEDRLQACIGIIEALSQGTDAPRVDAMQTALGLEAFYDGLWLNLLLYPDEFNRTACRQRALGHLAALFPVLIPAVQAAALPDPDRQTKRT